MAYVTLCNLHFEQPLRFRRGVEPTANQTPSFGLYQMPTSRPRVYTIIINLRSMRLDNVTALGCLISNSGAVWPARVGRRLCRKFP